MKAACAVISMLHEPPQRCSAQRLLRGEPVLSWTLRRLRGCRSMSDTAIVCWDDQAEAVASLAGSSRIMRAGPRRAVAQLDAVAASRRWCDGWRGGLLGTCSFDSGFQATDVLKAVDGLGSESAVLVDPAAALVDPRLIDGLVEHAGRKPRVELVFAPAAPGLGGALVRRSLLARLATTQGHPGRQLHYWPGVHGRDPIALDGCAAVSTPVARTCHGFLLNSERRIRRIERATAAMNGELIGASSELLVERMDAVRGVDEMPRDVVLELNTQRATGPVYNAARYYPAMRQRIPMSALRSLFAELAVSDDLRLTLGGVGDPVLVPDVLDILHAAKAAGVSAIHLETDLVGIDPATVGQLAVAPLDVISVHIPATTSETYRKIMGVDALGAAVENVKLLLRTRSQAARGTPIVVPTFMKCQDNLAEMEAWYDQWLNAVGAAVVAGPGDLGGTIPESGVADMSPPQRRACARLDSRMTVLCDGTVVSCEEDAAGRQMAGRIGRCAVSDIWNDGLAELREDHRCGRWGERPVCANCRQWFRP